MSGLTEAQLERGQEFAETYAEVPYEWPIEEEATDD